MKWFYKDKKNMMRQRRFQLNRWNKGYDVTKLFVGKNKESQCRTPFEKRIKTPLVKRDGITSEMC